MVEKLTKEFEYFLKHRDELVKKYNGKFVVIKNERVLGAYDTELAAVTETQKQHPLGTFLVQKCDPNSESFTQTFHSRVSFC